MTSTRGLPHDSEPSAHAAAEQPDRDARSTRRLIIDLALVEDQMRSLSSRRAQAGPRPDGTALQDQLETHEREILRALNQRRLAFRALPATAA